MEVLDDVTGTLNNKKRKLEKSGKNSPESKQQKTEAGDDEFSDDEEFSVESLTLLSRVSKLYVNSFIRQFFF